MKIFISHSGERSKQLAEHVALFVKQLIQATDPWISTGMDKGLKWLPEIAENLEASALGVVCLTKENLPAPWILFEAGALAKRLNDKVLTLVLDVDKNAVDLPLGQFQATRADDPDDMWKFVATIAKEVRAAGSNPPDDAELKNVFAEYHWPRLSEQVERLKAEGPFQEPPRRSMDDMMEEVLATVRQIGQESSVMFARQEKMLRLTKRQYEEAVGRPAPSLRALQALARRAGGDPVFHQVLVRNPLMLDDPILLELLDREVERLEKLGVTEDTSEPEKPEQS